MATLVLGAVGSAVGGSFLPTIGLFGQTLTGAAIGQAVGATVGRYIDQALFGASGQKRTTEGPRLSDVYITSSTEGSHIPRLYGRARLPGQMIWATRFEEEIITTSESTGSGGKGGSSRSSNTVTRVQYNYYANFAVSLAEGEITRLGRVWADGKELNLSDYQYRFYSGSETQMPDSLIEAKEGSGNAPSYRGIAYIVFERMPLARFGNRIPQLSFELFRSVDEFDQTVKGLTLIPGSGEFVYEQQEVLRDVGGGAVIPENVHTLQGGSDWDVAVAQMVSDLPKVKNVSLIASWFGSDLRAAHCELRPGIENREKTTHGIDWLVAGQTRSTAYQVSEYEGRPAYGGTPSDASVISAIQDLKAKGFGVTLNPFILMDVPEANSLPDPYGGGSGQAVYPWRGRITIDPAPGEGGSPDKTAAAGGQVAPFIGTTALNDFSVNGETVSYTGSDPWTFRHMILHYAHLAQAAGGVDAFIIGSEMRGLTWVRDSADHYPFVDALIQLASDVKSVLGSSTKVTYGADWSEYFGHQPADGSGDVYFHLDPLWASSNIDAIGIDNYWPLTDWRDGETHLDAIAGAPSIYDLDYLKSNIKGGEGYDWYYASTSDRDNQVRTPITDGSGKPWVFRYKDIKNWWENDHYNRPGGVEATTSTAWVPQSKPFWITELGCPAVNKGSNQPNVFYDPKSDESALPYYSNGARDDFIQRRHIQAFYDYFDDAHEDFQEANNPASTSYAGRMLALNHVYVYTWDARPYPAFPADVDSWGDGPNWVRGHWLIGRIGSVSLPALVAAILNDYGFDAIDVTGLEGIIDGYVIDRIMPARAAIQPLELAMFFDSFEQGDKIKFAHRGKASSSLQLEAGAFVDPGTGNPLYEITRGQETELPRSAKISFIQSGDAYQSKTVEARDLVTSSDYVATTTLPMVMSEASMIPVAERWVQENWMARERAQFALPLSAIALEPSDLVELSVEGGVKKFRVTEISDLQYRTFQAQSITPEVYDFHSDNTQLPVANQPVVFGPSKALFLDLPLLTGEDVPEAGWVAATQKPWPGSIAFYRSPETSGFQLNQLVTAPARIGSLNDDLSATSFNGAGRLDHANHLSITLDHGSVESRSLTAMLSGQNTLALEHDNQLWEIIQFQDAQLVSANTYELQGLLRAQSGTEEAATSMASAGAALVILDEALKQVTMTLDDISRPQNWLYGPANKDISHPSYQQQEVSFDGQGLRPLSPVHLKGKGVNNDFHISWIRRTRTGGDNWALEEVPLGEDVEAYEVDIMDGGVVKRTLATGAPTVTYTEADQISDWGGVQASYLVRVYQLGSQYGRGSRAERLLLA